MLLVIFLCVPLMVRLLKIKIWELTITFCWVIHPLNQWKLQSYCLNQKGLHGLKSRILPSYKTFQQNLHLTEQNDLGNKKVTPTPHPQREKKKNQPTTPQQKSQKRKGVECLCILSPVNDFLKVVLVFDQERDTSIHSHQTKVDLVLKTRFQYNTVIYFRFFRARSMECCLISVYWINQKSMFKADEDNSPEAPSPGSEPSWLQRFRYRYHYK